MGEMKKCRICGSEFYVESIDEWGYEIKKDYFCTYTCMRKFEKDNPNCLKTRSGNTRSKGQNRFSDEMKEYLITEIRKNSLLPRGERLKFSELAIKLGVSHSTVENYSKYARKRAKEGTL